MVSKITALYDWIFEEEHGYGKVNDFAVMIAKKAVNSFVRTPFTSIQDDLFLKELLDSLAMSGIANEIAGSSAPTSGSEHLISHALDKMLEHPQLHGIQVGIATYLMSVVQDHRYRRVDTIFMQTGFWDYVKHWIFGGRILRKQLIWHRRSNRSAIRICMSSNIGIARRNSCIQMRGCRKS